MPPRPKPTVLKVVSGTLRKSRMNKQEPKPEPAIPSPPVCLKDEALSEWKRLSQQLYDMGILTDIDRATLALYCQIWGRWMKAEKHIADGGEIITTPNGCQQASPWVAISRQSAEACRKLCIELGMTPAARSKVKATPPRGEENKWSYFD